GTGPRHRVPGDRRGAVQVVIHDQHRAAGAANTQQCPQLDHLPLVVLHLELPDVPHPVAVAGVGLDVDLPGSAELVEVVDVEAAQVILERIEHIADLHAQRHALAAINLQVQPGRVGPRTV